MYNYRKIILYKVFLCYVFENEAIRHVVHLKITHKTGMVFVKKNNEANLKAISRLRFNI